MVRRHSVAPDRCALAIAFPLSREELEEDLRRGDELDFVRSILRRNPGLSEAGAWSLYGPIAATIERIAAEVGALGVCVRSRCTLADLVALLRQFEVVTLAAHCRLLAFTAADVVDPDGFAAAVRRQPAPDAAAGWVRAAVLETLAMPAPAGGPAATVIAALNRLVQPAHDRLERPSAQRPAPPAGADEEAACWLTRAELEYRYPELLVAGRCVELRDGLHPIPELARAVREGLAGIFDLSLCNSAILERALKAARQSCLLIINRQLAAIDARMIRYKLIIGALARAPAPFLDVLTEVHLRLEGA